MEYDLEPPIATASAATSAADHSLSPPYTSPTRDLDSNCSTPYVSAPSSPGRSFPANVGFFYSAPASPMHYVLATAPSSFSGAIPSAASAAPSSGSADFEFSARFDSPALEIGCSSTMSSADELFFNGQIRPMKLSAHLQRPQTLAPLIDSGDDFERDDDDEDDVVFQRSRNSRFRDRSQRRRTRSLSPLRKTPPSDWFSNEDAISKGRAERENGDGENRKVKEETENETTPSGSGRSSKRWVFLKEFLRSKSEGGSNNRFWHNININISFSPAKEKKERGRGNAASFSAAEKTKVKNGAGKDGPAKKSAAGKRRSAHEMHYTANRAQAEEMRKKTFLPYRQGLLGCLGFNSKSYGALNGFAKALNPVSSG